MKTKQKIDFFAFLKNIYSSDKPESSKRFFGSIGFIVSIVYVGFNPAHLNTLIYVSGALLGLGILDKTINK